MLLDTAGGVSIPTVFVRQGEGVKIAAEARRVFVAEAPVCPDIERPLSQRAGSQPIS